MRAGCHPAISGAELLVRSGDIDKAHDALSTPSPVKLADCRLLRTSGSTRDCRCIDVERGGLSDNGQWKAPSCAGRAAFVESGWHRRFVSDVNFVVRIVCGQ
jgi:hypothetical protein